MGVRFVITSLTCLVVALACDGAPPAPDAGVVDAPPDAGFVPHGPLFVNEAQSSNATTVLDNSGEADDWLELYNDAGDDVVFDGLTLEDQRSGPLPFPAGAVVPAGGFLVVFCDDTPAQGTAAEPHFAFKLSHLADRVTLKDAAGTVLDALALPALTSDTSIGRLPDGTDTIATFEAPTPGAPNHAGEGEGEGEGEGDCVPPFAGALPIVVNEVLVDNVAAFADPDDGAFQPWIELYNAGAAPASLDGLTLANHVDNLGAWPMPARVLDPGAFVVVMADGEPAQGIPGQGVEHASFLLIDGDAAVVLADRCGTVAQTVDLVGGGADLALGLLPDGDVAGVGPRATPTPGAPNQ